MELANLSLPIRLHMKLIILNNLDQKWARFKVSWVENKSVKIDEDIVDLFFAILVYLFFSEQNFARTRNLSQNVLLSGTFSAESWVGSLLYLQPS